MSGYDMTVYPLQKLVDSAGAGVWVWDIEHGEFWTNSAVLGITGLDSVKSLEDIRMLVDEKDAASIRKFMDECNNGVRNSFDKRYSIICGDRKKRWVYEHCIVEKRGSDGRALFMSGLLYDITKERKREEALSLENKYRMFISHQAGLGGWEWTADGNRISFSDDYRKLLGRLPEELDGTVREVCENHVHPEDVRFLEESFWEYVKNPKDIFQIDFKLLHRDGHFIWVQNTANAVEFDNEGNVSKIIGGILDIDRQKRTEERLREINTAMFEGNMHVNILFDSNNSVIGCNPAALDLFCFDNEEAFLQGFEEALKFALLPVQSNGKPALSVKENFIITAREGYNLFAAEVMKSGRIRTFDVHSKKVTHDGTFAVFVSMIDITHIIEAQHMLEKQDNLLSVINMMTSELISAQPDEFEDNVYKALMHIGTAAGVDRVRVWQKVQKDGIDYVDEIYRWNQEKRQNAKLTSRRLSDLPYRDDMLLRRMTINSSVHDLPDIERRAFIMQGIKSILIIPMYVEDEFWGFIGFDDMSRYRNFTLAEESALNSAGNIIISAHLRNIMTQKLITAREDALSGMRAKSDFLSRMSHEIRTPMNAIIGMTTVARKADDIQRIYECLEKVDSSSKQLLGIINDILDMAKIEADKFEIGSYEFNFEKMLENIFNILQVKFDEKRLDFSYDFDRAYTRYMISDELRLTQVLTNLLSNAVKFTPECGVIRLRVREAEAGREKSLLRFEVADNGIGIDSERIKNLFESFEQADGSITRQFGGTGLGLAISKKIVELMGGRIWVESEQGAGSTFIFEVEVGWGSVANEIMHTRRIREDVRIMVVDDMPDVLEYISSILESFALTADTMTGAIEAIDAANHSLKEGRPYDIAFVDWNMPEMNGGETAVKLREILGEDVIIVMISVSEYNEIVHEINEYGVTRFLQKPILPSALYNILLGTSSESTVLDDQKRDYDWSDKHLLLTEDIEINREIVIALLEDTGINIDVATDGVDAIKKYSENHDKYDIIFMDVQMPILDGISATRKIRELDYETAKTVPVIAMTANAFKEDAENCYRAGMNGHVAKPIVVDILFDVLEKYLS